MCNNNKKVTGTFFIFIYVLMYDIVRGQVSGGFFKFSEFVAGLGARNEKRWKYTSHLYFSGGFF